MMAMGAWGGAGRMSSSTSRGKTPAACTITTIGKSWPTRRARRRLTALGETAPDREQGRGRRGQGKGGRMERGGGSSEGAESAQDAAFPKREH